MWAQRIWYPSPFHINPNAHAEVEEMSENEQRRSELLGDAVEDNPVLGRPRSRKEKAAHHQGQSPECPKGKHKCNEIAMGE